MRNHSYIREKHQDNVRILLELLQRTSNITESKNENYIKKENNMIKSVLDKPSYIYISRSKLSKDLRHFQEEKELERYLEIMGCKIFHPQLYTIKEQKEIWENQQCKMHLT